MQAALQLLKAEHSDAHANMAGLLTAEAEAVSGRVSDAEGTLDIFAGTLDWPAERAYAAYVGALVAAIGGSDAGAAAAAVEAAVQTQLDAVQVQCPCFYFCFFIILLVFPNSRTYTGQAACSARRGPGGRLWR